MNISWPGTTTGTGSGTGIDTSFTTVSGLAAIDSSSTTLGTVKLYYDEDYDEVQAWQLRSGTAATSAGVTQRPDDYSAGTNERVWYRVPLA